MMHKRERKLGENRCQCGSCGEYFNSAYAFDKHRTGDYGGLRRCRSPSEMTAAGMAESRGWWISSARELDADAVSSRTREQISAFQASDVVLHAGATETAQERAEG